MKNNATQPIFGFFLKVFNWQTDKGEGTEARGGHYLGKIQVVHR